MESLIYGMLLGDSSISRDKTTFTLQTSHSESQLPYLKWKAQALGFKGKLIPRISGYGGRIYKMGFYNRDLLAPVYDVCVQEGVKKINEEWLGKLDSLSLAVWFQDDGSWMKSGKRTALDRSQRISQFHVQGFDSNSQELLAEWLRSKGYAAVIKPHKKKYRVIQLNHSSTVKLWHEIAPYVVLDYKIDNRRGDVDTCTCGKYKNIHHKECDECIYSLSLETIDIPRRQNNNIRDRLRCHFGTSSIKALQKKPIEFSFPKPYRIEPSVIGSKVKYDRFPFG